MATMVLLTLMLHLATAVLLRYSTGDSAYRGLSVIAEFDHSGALVHTIATEPLPPPVPACLKAYSPAHNTYWYFGRPANSSLGSGPKLVSVDLATGNVSFTDVSTHTDPDQFLGSLDYSDTIDALIFTTYGSAMSGTGQAPTVVFTLDRATKVVTQRLVVSKSAYFDSQSCLSSTGASQFLDWNPLSQNRTRSVLVTDIHNWTTQVIATHVPEQIDVGAFLTDGMYSAFADAGGAVYGLVCLNKKQCPAVVKTDPSWSHPLSVVASIDSFPNWEQYTSGLDQNHGVFYVAHTDDVVSTLDMINLTSQLVVHAKLPGTVGYVEHIIA